MNWINLSAGGGVSGYPTIDDAAIFEIAASIQGGEANTVDVYTDASITSIGHLTLAVRGELYLHTGSLFEGGVIESEANGLLNGTRQFHPGDNRSGVLRDVTLDGHLVLSCDIAGTISFVGHTLIGGSSSYFARGGVGIPTEESVVLEGPGTVRMSGSSDTSESFGRFESAAQGQGQLINRLDNGISGSGEFRSLHIINESTIRSDTGQLYLREADIDNHSGMIVLADQFSEVSMEASSITGGTISGSGYAMLWARNQSSVIADVRLQGSLSLGGRSGYATRLYLQGVITNNGSLRVEADSRFAQGLYVQDGMTATISGGAIRIEGFQVNSGSNGSLGTGTNALLILDDVLLHGEGKIGSGMIENRGLIRADSGNIVFDGTTVDNTDGRIEILDGSTLRVGSGLARIIGGTIHGEPGSAYMPKLLRNARDCVFNNVTISGEILVGTPSSHGSLIPTTTIEDTLTNNATLQILDVADTSPRPGHVFGFPSNQATVVGGTGRIFMNDRAYGGLRGAASSVLIHESPHEIIGSGRIDLLSIDNRSAITAQDGILRLWRSNLGGSGVITVAADGILLVQESTVQVDTIAVEQGGEVILQSGTLEAGTIGGTLTHESGSFNAGPGVGLSLISGPYTQTTSNAELRLTLAGRDEYDRLRVESDATLSGPLTVLALDGYEPVPGDEFLIFEVFGIRTGEFAGLSEGDSAARIGGSAEYGGVDLLISYQAGDGNDISLTARLAPCSLVDFAPPFGTLDLADIAFFVLHFLEGNPMVDLVEPIGVLDLADIVAFVTAFNAGCT